MQEFFKKYLDESMRYWQNLSKKTKTFIVSIAAGVLLLTVGITFAMNFLGNSYVVLYPGMSPDETTQLVTALSGQSVPMRTNATGEVMVPRGQKDTLLVQLAIEGFPKSTLAYGLFTDNTGFTTTEFEKKTYLLLQLQDRIQDTLKKVNGIQNAVVTLDVSQGTNYVWEQANQKSSAGVMLTLKPGTALEPEVVNGLKNLIAASIPNLSPENVVFTDAATGIELAGTDSPTDSVAGDLKRLGFEKEIENKISGKILNVLSLGYELSNIRVSTTATIDYDKMITESTEYIPEDDGKGIASSEQTSYVTDGATAAEGIVGEEDNTDVPTYVTGENGEIKYINFSKNVEYYVSTIKKQIEKDKAILKDVSVSITIKDNNLDEAKKAALVDSAAMAGNIPKEKISVQSFALPEVVPTSPIIAMLTNPVVLGAIAGVLLLLIAAIVLLLRGRKKKIIQMQLARENEVATLIVDGVKFNNQAEVEAYKLQLKEAADASMNTKESAVINEVKEFAKKNPEITASLIKTWLRGEEDR